MSDDERGWVYFQRCPVCGGTDSDDNGEHHCPPAPACPSTSGHSRRGEHGGATMTEISRNGVNWTPAPAGQEYHSSLAGCLHGSVERPQPCPPMCPVQQWPHMLFRFRALRGDYVLRRKHRHLIDEWKLQRP